VIGTPPINASAGHTIAGMATQGHSIPGFEQFGMNLVANVLSPPDIAGPGTLSLGSNPDNGVYNFAYGAAGDVNHPTNPNYNTANQFVYNNGDLIASANKSGGFTNYTISYIINVGHLTPGGQYTTNQSLVVVGTY
jgi:hypothetical protein